MIADKDIQFLKSPITKKEAIKIAIQYGGLGSSLKEQGFWDASTNTPELQDGIGTIGYYYIVSVGGTVDFGNGNITFTVGDWVYYNTSNEWVKFETGVDYVPVNKAGDTMTGGLITPELIVGDAGTEGSGINIAGTTYESSFKVSDIDGTNYAQTILHRHSTTLEPLIVGARSNSNTSSHADVTNSQNLFSVYGAGYAGSHYKLFGAIYLGVDSTGTVSNTSSPGRFIVAITPDGSTTPVTALTIRNNKNIEFAGNPYFQSNVESLSANKTLTATSATYQFLDPNGANRDVTLPTAATNMLFIIKNTGTSGYTLTVKDSGGSAITGGTIANTVAMGFYYNGSSWQLV